MVLKENIADAANGDMFVTVVDDVIEIYCAGAMTLISITLSEAERLNDFVIKAKKARGQP